MTFYERWEDDKKYQKRIIDQDKKHKESDARMKHGKNFKDFMSGKEKPLRPGEVKRYDKNLKKWVSNKD